MSKRKLVLAYVCLVGLPLLCLVGIIRAGQHLSPPISVGGTWNLEADFSPWQGGPCQEVVGSVNQPFFSVSQSGADLIIALNNAQRTALAGELHGSALTVNGTNSQAVPDNSGSCRSPEAFNLTATVAGQAEKRVLTGTLEIAGCSSCPPVAFRATRQSSSEKGGR